MLRILALAILICLGHVAESSAAGLRAEVTEARTAALQWADLNVARKAGWRPFGGEAPLMGRHYTHRDQKDYVHGEEIDFSRPSNLVYATIDGRQMLVAFAYIVQKAPEEPLPEGFSGTRDVWHVHDGARFLSAMRESRPFIANLAGRWFTNNLSDGDRTQLAMVHLWLIPNPKGQFASHNPALAYRDLGLPLDWASPDMEPARGLALTRDGGCSEALDAELWIAGVDRRRTRGLLSNCRQIAAWISQGIDGSERQVEARATEGWQRLEDLRHMAMTDAERRRSKAFVEDGPGVCR